MTGYATKTRNMACQLDGPFFLLTTPSLEGGISSWSRTTLLKAVRVSTAPSEKGWPLEIQYACGFQLTVITADWSLPSGWPSGGLSRRLASLDEIGQNEGRSTRADDSLVLK